MSKIWKFRRKVTHLCSYERDPLCLSGVNYPRNDGDFTALCEVTVNETPVPYAVDLGLPSGLKRASFNLGASKPKELGNYYAWGETMPKQMYDWTTYKWFAGDPFQTESTLTKYCTISSKGYNGFTDRKTVLDPEDDVAHVALGGNWRMPEYYEFEELRTMCTWKWTSMNGVNGCTFTGPNGSSIFLPAAGHRFKDDVVSSSSSGYYWSSSLYDKNPYLPWHLVFSSDQVQRDHWYRRCYGFSIRPVSE